MVDSVLDIRNVSDLCLQELLHKYQVSGRTTGAIFTHAQIVREQRRRAKALINGKVMFDQILRLLCAERKLHDVPEAATITYSRIWAMLVPGQKWTYRVSLQKVMAAMDACIHYCVAKDLPQLTVLITPINDNEPGKNAVRNIHGAVRQLKPEIVDCADSYVRDETYKARAYVSDQLKAA